MHRILRKFYSYSRMLFREFSRLCFSGGIQTHFIFLFFDEMVFEFFVSTTMGIPKKRKVSPYKKCLPSIQMVGRYAVELVNVVPTSMLAEPYPSRENRYIYCTGTKQYVKCIKETLYITCWEGGMEKNFCKLQLNNIPRGNNISSLLKKV